MSFPACVTFNVMEYGSQWRTRRLPLCISFTLFQTQRQLSDAVWNGNHWKETHSNVLDVNILHSITQEKGQKYAFLVRWSVPPLLIGEQAHPQQWLLQSFGLGMTADWLTGEFVWRYVAAVCLGQVSMHPKMLVFSGASEHYSTDTTASHSSK